MVAEVKDGQHIILGYIPIESPSYKFFRWSYPDMPRHMAFSHSCPLPQALMQELYTTTSGCNCASYLLGRGVIHPWKLMWNHVEPSITTCKMFCLFLTWQSSGYILLLEMYRGGHPFDSIRLHMLFFSRLSATWLLLNSTMRHVSQNEFKVQFKGNTMTPTFLDGEIIISWWFLQMFQYLKGAMLPYLRTIRS